MPELQTPPTLKLAVVPATTEVSAGCGVMVSTGAPGVTVSTAPWLVALPATLLTMARKLVPLSVSTAAATA